MSDAITLVTGGAGFLGRHVVALLEGRGDPVRVVDTQGAPEGCGADWRQGSVTDPQFLSQAFADVSEVIHLAAIPHLWSADSNAFDRVNHLGTQRVVDAAWTEGVSAFVHVSSLTTRISGEKSSLPRRVREADLPPLDAMLGAYPRSKWLAEDAARRAQAEGMPVRIAIPTMPLGPGDFSMTPPTRMALDFVSGKTPAYLDTWMNICDVRDMAAGIVALLDVPAPESGVFLGGNNLRMGEVLEHLQAASGVAMPKARVPGFVAEAFAYLDEFAADHLTHKLPKAPLTGVRLARRPIQFDMSLARELLKFEARPLDETLSDLLVWFEAQGYWHHQDAG